MGSAENPAVGHQPSRREPVYRCRLICAEVNSEDGHFRPVLVLQSRTIELKYRGFWETLATLILCWIFSLGVAEAMHWALVSFANRMFLAGQINVDNWQILIQAGWDARGYSLWVLWALLVAFEHWQALLGILILLVMMIHWLGMAISLAFLYVRNEISELPHPQNSSRRRDRNTSHYEPLSSGGAVSPGSTGSQPSLRGLSDLEAGLNGFSPNPEAIREEQEQPLLGVMIHEESEWLSGVDRPEEKPGQ
jgi:hypothetical protein